MQSWKKCVLPDITTMAMWQLMHLDTWCTFHIAGTNEPLLALYIYIYIYINVSVDVIVSRLPHPRSGDSQGQETFLAPSADKQTWTKGQRDWAISTLRTKGLSRSRMKWWAIYTNLPVDVKWMSNGFLHFLFLSLNFSL